MNRFSNPKVGSIKPQVRPGIKKVFKGIKKIAKKVFK